MPKNNRVATVVRMLLLAVLGLGATACCYDWHYGYGHYHSCWVPVHRCCR